MLRNFQFRKSCYYNSIIKSFYFVFSQLIGAEGEDQTGAKNCYSILVETGVYSPDDETDQQVALKLN